MHSFGKRVREAREHAKLSQVEVSKSSGVAQTTISKIERGLLDHEEAVSSVRYARLLSVLGLAGDRAPPEAPPPAPGTPGSSAAAQVEDAVGRAFVPGVHRAGDMAPVLSEAASVLEVFGPEGATRDELLTACAKLWLDAAAELRRRGLTVSARTLLAQTTLLAIAGKTAN